MRSMIMSSLAALALTAPLAASAMDYYDPTPVPAPAPGAMWYCTAEGNSFMNNDTVLVYGRPSYSRGSAENEALMACMAEQLFGCKVIGCSTQY